MATASQVFKERDSRLTMQKRSKVNLIDLAGSERTGAIGNKGVVFEEGASINKSLTVLGRCIKALCDGAKVADDAPPEGKDGGKDGGENNKGKKKKAAA